MLGDKQINEIVSKNMDKFVSAAVTDNDYEVCCDVLSDVVKEALALAEKTKWEYPDKGELPEILADYIIFYLRGRLSKPKIGMAYKDKDGNFIFFCNDTNQGYSQHEVKAWTYAPVLDEEPLPRSERLEKLTAERDALLKEDGGADES